MKNPYEVLGISSRASDAEVKQAYRDLARQYSADGMFSESEAAAKQIQELNDAYDAIIMTRHTAGAQGDGFGRGGQNASEYADIRQTIQSGRLDDAQILLDGIPEAGRSAEWYFLKGSLHHQRGWLEHALDCFQTAVDMEPNNAEYRAALDNLLRNQSGGYRSAGGSRGSHCNARNLCAGLMCANCLCNCLSGGRTGRCF